MPHHLEPVRDDDLGDDEFGPGLWEDPFGEGVEDEPLRRPPWWRWVAVLVILAMVVAGPVAYGLYRLLS